MVSPQKISSYLRKPYELDAEAEQELRSLLKDTHYFANAWLLMARSLHNQQSPLFDDALKQAAMYAGDRKLLYALVNLADKQTAAVPLDIFTPGAPAAPPVTTQEVPVAKFEETIASHEPTNEQEKVASAYEEFFGASSADKNENVTTEFETFEIEPPVIADDIHTEEDFELDLGEHLDGDHDGIIRTTPDEEHTEEAFELEIADHLVDKYSAAQPADEHNEEEFALAMDNHFEEDEEFYTPIDHQDENPLGGGAEYTEEIPAFEAPGTQIPEAPGIMAEEEEEEEQPAETAPVAQEAEVPATADETENIETAGQTLNEPIAFKLETKEPYTSPVAERTAPPAETEKEPANFYEWLQQLKSTKDTSEKKNDFVERAASAPEPKVTSEPAEHTPADTKTVDAATPPPPTGKPNVDDIISRFINLNPTISRPKAEFYNPVVKAKDSDTERDDLATETLAKIYLKQNLTEKAVATYEKLKTLHPEKAAYFQSAIDEVRSK